MKLEMDLKPKDIVLLKVLGCVLIAFVMIRFLIFPGIEKHMDLVDQRDEVVAEQEDMQALIDRKDTFDAIIANQQSSLKSAQEGYYDLLENREVDELITGIVLNHNLFPVYLNITDTTAGVPHRQRRAVLRRQTVLQILRRMQHKIPLLLTVQTAVIQRILRQRAVQLFPYHM